MCSVWLSKARGFVDRNLLQSPTEVKKEDLGVGVGHSASPGQGSLRGPCLMLMGNVYDSAIHFPSLRMEQTRSSLSEALGSISMLVGWKMQSFQVSQPPLGHPLSRTYAKFFTCLQRLLLPCVVGSTMRAERGMHQSEGRRENHCIPARIESFIGTPFGYFLQPARPWKSRSC